MRGAAQRSSQCASHAFCASIALELPPLQRGALRVLDRVLDASPSGSDPAPGRGRPPPRSAGASPRRSGSAPVRRCPDGSPPLSGCPARRTGDTRRSCARPPRAAAPRSPGWSSRPPCGSSCPSTSTSSRTGTGGGTGPACRASTRPGRSPPGLLPGQELQHVEALRLPRLEPGHEALHRVVAVLEAVLLDQVLVDALRVAPELDLRSRSSSDAARRPTGSSSAGGSTPSGAGGRGGGVWPGSGSEPVATPGDFETAARTGGSSCDPPPCAGRSPDGWHRN